MPIKLYVKAAPWQCKEDVPKAKTLVAGEHLQGYGFWALDMVQEAVKVKLDHHLQEKKKSINMVVDRWAENLQRMKNLQRIRRSHLPFNW